MVCYIACSLAHPSLNYYSFKQTMHHWPIIFAHCANYINLYLRYTLCALRTVLAHSRL